MKIIVTTSELRQALKTLQKAIPSKPSLPILQSIRFEVNKTGVTLAATDLYFGVIAPLTAELINEGTAAIPGKLFNTVIQSLPDESLTLEVDKEQLIISSKATKSTIQCMAVDDFPEFPEASGEVRTLKTSTLMKIADLVLPSISKDVTRPVLTSVLLEFSKTGYRAVGTDGFRLSLLEENMTGDVESTLLFPAKALSEVSRLAVLLEEDEVFLSIAQADKQVCVQIGATWIFSRLIEGEFPPYSQIVPSGSSTTLSCDGTQLFDQLQRAAVFARESSSIVQFSCLNSQILITTPTTSSGHFEGVLNDIKIDGEEITVNFNAQYLLDIFKQFSDSEVKFAFTEPLKPVLCTASNLPNFKYVVMPFRVAA